MKVSELVKVTGALWLKKINPEAEIAGYSIDTRVINKNDCFFAIKGANYDGHDFVAKVQRKALCIVVENNNNAYANCETNVLLVDSTKNSLMRVAEEIRKRSSATTIAVTGSCGKTTTKEMLNHVLSGHYKINKSPYSFNNDIGVSLSLANLNGADVSIVEAGISKVGEMADLSRIIKPDIVCITTIGKAHLAGFKNADEIPVEKFKLVEHASKNAICILPKSLEILFKKNYPSTHTLTFGSLSESADIVFSDVSIGYDLMSVQIGETKIYVKCTGDVLASILVTCAVCKVLDISLNDTLKSFASFNQPPLRMQKIVLDYNTIFADCYNSNPTSCKSALNQFAGFPHPLRKLVILGSMLELGEESYGSHKEALEYAESLGLNDLILVGKEFAHWSDRYPYFENADNLSAVIKNILYYGDLILIKGSRESHLEKVVETVAEDAINEEMLIKKNSLLEV